MDLFLTRSGLLLPLTSEYGKSLKSSGSAFIIKISENREEDLKIWLNSCITTRLALVRFGFDEEQNTIQMWEWPSNGYWERTEHSYSL
jgi:hypothetical protein